MCRIFSWCVLPMRIICLLALCVHLALAIEPYVFTDIETAPYRVTLSQPAAPQRIKVIWSLGGPTTCLWPSPDSRPQDCVYPRYNSDECTFSVVPILEWICDGSPEAASTIEINFCTTEDTCKKIYYRATDPLKLCVAAAIELRARQSKLSPVIALYLLGLIAVIVVLYVLVRLFRMFRKWKRFDYQSTD